VSVADVLAAHGLPGADLGEAPASAKRFADGAAYRVEIPSTEGPRCMEAILEEAARLDVPVHRVSQGSGVGLLAQAELEEFAALGREHGVEVCLFARPNAAWGRSASARSAAGAALAPVAWGMDQVNQQLDEIRRAADLGFRSVLIADIGVLRLFSALRESGDLPPDMQAKISVMLPAANPASALVLEELGADTINVPVDLSLAQLAAIRAAIDVPLDIYIEAPDNLGGIVRMHEIAEIVRVASPVHVKFGLRNAPDLYPSGTHLETTAVALSRERVRRARIGLDRLGGFPTSAVPAPVAAHVAG
jgi:hypothetical protein